MTGDAMPIRAMTIRFNGYDDRGDFCATCDELIECQAFYGEDYDECRRCALRGCIDDMCHGQGWCMHR